MLVLVKTTYQW